jgi:mercuric reductase
VDRRACAGGHRRRLNTAGLGIAAVGVETDHHGGVRVDRHLRSTVSSLYAARDAASLPQFVYVAAESGSTPATNALQLGDRALGLTAWPRVPCKDPAVASVGLSEAEADAQNIPCACASLSVTYVPRALANHEQHGVIKVVAHRASEQVLGVHIVAPDAGEMITLGTVAVRYGMTVEDLTGLFVPYLTMTEGVKLAALAFHQDIRKLSCCAGA